MIDTAIVQPALFTVEYALARLLMTLGLGPVATIGHSIGEYVSACLAGVFSLEDALALVAERGRLMQLMPAGAMAAIGLAESALRPRLVPGVAIAAVNGPEICLVSVRRLRCNRSNGPWWRIKLWYVDFTRRTRSTRR